MRDSGNPVAVLARVEGLSAGYGAGPVVLEHVTFEVRSGERLGVLGPNGGGKSTLFRVLLGELEPRAGSVTLAARCAIVPQTERSRLDYPVSALDVAATGALARLRWWRPLGRKERRVALAALGRVGLADTADAQFGELSGGQRQRVLVARALVQQAEILLLDEPFSNLDVPSAERLERLLEDLAGEGRGLLVATHDIDQARAWDRVLCLNRRQVGFGLPGEILTREVLEQTYGGSIVTISDEGGVTSGVLPPHHHG